jgi:hypothetical protein
MDGVRRLGGLALVGLTGLAFVAAASTADRPKISVDPARPVALEPARIELRAPAQFPLSGARIRARSPEGRLRLVRTAVVQRGVRRGTFRFPAPGPWDIVVTDTRGVRVPSVPSRRVDVLDPAPTPAPDGFGALGQRGCNPPSPASGTMAVFRDIFGTAIGGQELWALPFLPPGTTWPTPHLAVFEGLVGKEIKIVFAMTTFHQPFRAIGLDGMTLDPVWGPEFHGRSNWIRQPGAEWGAGFVFPTPGCWRIAVGSRGDLWFLVRS